MTDPFDTVSAAKDAGHEKAREWRRTPDATAWETVREALRLLVQGGIELRARRAPDAIAALASLQAAYEAMVRERDHHEKRADNAFDLAKMSEERLEAAERKLIDSEEKRYAMQKLRDAAERERDQAREEIAWLRDMLTTAERRVEALTAALRYCQLYGNKAIRARARKALATSEQAHTKESNDSI